MDSLQDLLAKRTPDLPAEIIAVKKYVAEHFDGRDIGVSLTESTIILHVNSAAFAGSLKNHSRQLQAAAHTTKRISFRIST